MWWRGRFVPNFLLKSSNYCCKNLLLRSYTRTRSITNRQQASTQDLLGICHLCPPSLFHPNYREEFKVNASSHSVINKQRWRSSPVICLDVLSGRLLPPTSCWSMNIEWMVWDVSPLHPGRSARYSTTNLPNWKQQRLSYQHQKHYASIPSHVISRYLSFTSIELSSNWLVAWLFTSYTLTSCGQGTSTMPEKTKDLLIFIETTLLRSYCLNFHYRIPKHIHFQIWLQLFQ